MSQYKFYILNSYLLTHLVFIRVIPTSNYFMHKKFNISLKCVVTNFSNIAAYQNYLKYSYIGTHYELKKILNILHNSYIINI